MRTCRALRPRRSRAPGHYSARAFAFRSIDDVGSSSSHISRLYHTAYPLAVYASQGGLPHLHARLASSWRPTLAGRDSHPLGPLQKVSRCCIPTSSFLLLQALPGATSAVTAVAPPLATGTNRGEPPGRGRTGHPPAGSRSHPRPPQVPLASLILPHPLARGVDIIARDYVKVTRSVSRRRELARARSENAGILGSRCKSRDRLAHDPFHAASLARLLAYATKPCPVGHPFTSGRGQLPPELGAGDIQARPAGLQGGRGY